MPVADTWLEVEGDWIPEPADAAGQAADDRPPRLRLIRMRRIDTPTVPYE